MSDPTVISHVEIVSGVLSGPTKYARAILEAEAAARDAGVQVIDTVMGGAHGG